MPMKPRAELRLKTRPRLSCSTVSASHACSAGANGPAAPFAPRPNPARTIAVTSGTCTAGGKRHQSAGAAQSFVSQQKRFASKPITGQSHGQAETGADDSRPAQHAADCGAGPPERVQIKRQIHHHRALGDAPPEPGGQQPAGSDRKRGGDGSKSRNDWCPSGHRHPR